MDDKSGQALDLLQRALHLMDQDKRPLVAARIAAAIDDLVRDAGPRVQRLH